MSMSMFATVLWKSLALGWTSSMAPTAPIDRLPTQPYADVRVYTTSKPVASIAAWHLPSKERVGTVFVTHGFRNEKSLLLSYQWMRDRLGWDMVYFDIRGHGSSTMPLGDLPTLGYQEIWDVKAVVDWADAHHLPKPYVMFGPSMGGSIMMRWAGSDSRISGVMAMGPYVSAWDALHKFEFAGHAPGRLVDDLVGGAGRSMLQTVDQRAAVARRSDLLLWITCGSNDVFGPDDQQQLINASASPANLKRLVVIPNSGHGDWWRWPGFDPMIESFLEAAKHR